jgi:translation initiation factor 2A
MSTDNINNNNDNNNKPPPCRLLFRSKEGVELFSIPSERNEETTIQMREERGFILKGQTSFQAVVPDGSAVLVHRPEKGIIKLDLNDTSKNNNNNTDTPFFSDTSRVQIMDISPQGTFVLTWERAKEGDVPNLKVWNVTTGEYVIGFRQRSLSRDSWPYLQWTYDEKFAFLLGTNEIRVYPGLFPQSQETRFVDKIRITGITSMSLPSQSKGSTSTAKILFTSFIPKDKNRPSRAALYEYPSTKEVAKNTDYPSLVSKSLFQAEEMKVHWSPKGDAALIALQSTVDTSGQSYYGSTLLYLMSPRLTDTVAVPLPQEGPVLDVEWMPNAEKPPCFVVIAGRMPAMASLHNGTDGKATFLFGNRHQNTIAWAPHGRFLTLAGFGNLVSFV